MFLEKEASYADMWTLSQLSSEPLREFIKSFKVIISNIMVSEEVYRAALRKA